MRIYTLPNPQSHAAMQWLLQAADAPLEAWISQAFDAAIRSSFSCCATDDYEIVASELATRLQAECGRRFAWHEHRRERRERPGDGLMLRLLRVSIDAIDWYAVAEGLLRELGKWNPPEDVLPADASAAREDDEDDDFAC